MIFWTVPGVLESYGGGVAIDSGHTNLDITRVQSSKDLANTDNDICQTARTIVREKYLAVQFFVRSDPRQFGKLVEDVENSITIGTYYHPKIVNKA